MRNTCARAMCDAGGQVDPRYLAEPGPRGWRALVDPLRARSLGRDRGGLQGAAVCVNSLSELEDRLGGELRVVASGPLWFHPPALPRVGAAIRRHAPMAEAGELGRLRHLLPLVEHVIPSELPTR